MRYVLVATTGYLLIVDLVNKVVVPLEGHRTEYYGVSWFPNSHDLVLSHSGLRNADLVNIDAYARSEVGWISAGALESNRFLSAPHQITCAPDGRVICTNTGRNVITAIDLKKPGAFHEVGVGPARWDRLSLESVTGDHLNSVFIKEDRLYAIAHRHTKGSLLATFSYPDLELVLLESLGERTGLHNIWMTSEGQKISCHSEVGGIVDLATNTTLWEAGSPIYTRGLAASEDHVLVGESQRTRRDLRTSSLSGLWILDRQSWKAVDYICLGPYGAVHEVRLLDVPDEAHHGHAFLGMERLLAGGDLFRNLFCQRLEAAQAATTAREIWRDFDMVFGAPEITSDGARLADEDSLCLAIQKSSNTGGVLRFDYTLGISGQPHASAVVGYRGAGGDTDMVAILLQPAEQSASLSVWRQNGVSWSLVPGICVQNLPLSGVLQLTASETELRVAINQNEVLKLKAKALGLEMCNTGMGIRWIGASVKPKNPTN